MLLDLFEKEVNCYVKERILDPLCRDVEEDLRLGSHLHLKLDDRNPFKVCVCVCAGVCVCVCVRKYIVRTYMFMQSSLSQIGLRDLKHFMEVKPVRFFDRSIDIRGT